MSIYNQLTELLKRHGAGYFVLIDPDAKPADELGDFTRIVCASGADAILVGGSLLLKPGYEQKVTEIKKAATIPVILFPGSLSQVSGEYDAILFISVISGRNPDYLFGQHVLGAPRILAMGVETISTGYMLIESGRTTTAEFMSNTRPLPAHKPDIAAAHAIAAQMMGFKMLYLEAGSGADHPVPNALIAAVKKYSRIPVIVGGGIRSVDTAVEKVNAGADFIVTGNVMEDDSNLHLMKDFADAIHHARSVKEKA